jgi:subtilase family serine protease
MTIFETDTKETLQYYSAAAVWRRPWNMPWGVVGYVSNTSSTQSITTSEADLTSLTVTITAVANRFYKISAKVGISTNTSAHTTTIRIYADGSAVDGTSGSRSSASNGFLSTITPVAYATGLAAGSRIIKLRALVDLDTSTARYSTETAYLIVEDIGPSSATPA